MAANKRKPETPSQVKEEEEEVETSEEEEEEEEEEVEEEVEEEEEDDEEEEETEESKRESVKKLLEPFSKDQILELLKSAALSNESIITQITKSADKDPTHRRVFVHGLAWDCTNETLLSSFRQYGEIETGNVVTDKISGKSKGYGFILFKTRKGAAKALKEPQKKIGNRMTACQLASAGKVNIIPNPNQTFQPKNIDASVSARKIYVANVASHLNPEKLKEFFQKFGEIEEGPIGFDRATGKLQGYALFLYKNVEGCNKALEQPMKVFDGCQLHCKKAHDRTQIGKFGQSGGSEMVTIGNVPLPFMNPAGVAALVAANPVGFMSPAAAIANAARDASQLDSRGEARPKPYGSMQTSIHNINSISPSVIGNYGSQAALQGLGVYQNSQLGQSPAGGQSGLGSLGGLPSYLGRR